MSHTLTCISYIYHFPRKTAIVNIVCMCRSASGTCAIATLTSMISVHSLPIISYPRTCITPCTCLGCRPICMLERDHVWHLMIFCLTGVPHCTLWRFRRVIVLFRHLLTKFVLLHCIAYGRNHLIHSWEQLTICNKTTRLGQKYAWKGTSLSVFCRPPPFSIKEQSPT